jgi:hypothetical protein
MSFQGIYAENIFCWLARLDYSLGRLIGNNQWRIAEKNWKAETLIRGEGLMESIQPQRIEDEIILPRGRDPMKMGEKIC